MAYEFEEEVQPDKGCEYSATCQSCPLPKCKLDYHGRVPVELKHDIIARRVLQGTPVHAVAHSFKVSSRIVKRSVKNFEVAKVEIMH